MSKRYFCEYTTPENFDDMIMVSDGVSLCSLVFKNSPDVTKAFERAAGREKENVSEEGRGVLLKSRSENCLEKELEKCDNLEIFARTREWLDIYFSGKNPDFLPSLSPGIRTEFCARVSEIMKEIPYGRTMTYGEIAKRIAEEKGIKRMSAQAVGGAVGLNPVCIIIPCHRVLGAKGKLMGYGGGIKNKIELLKLEGINNIRL